MGIRNHRGTGRLWAMLVQLKEEEGEEKQCKYLDKALNEVPKSGEVWCEGARIRLSPRTKTFDLGVAEKYLKFAVQFTPQYGDSFLESCRVKMLRRVEARARNLRVEGWESIRIAVEEDDIYGEGWEGGGGGEREVQRRRRAKVGREVLAKARDVGGRWEGGEGMGEAEIEEDEWYRCMIEGGMEELERICVNADPNYGMMWFENRIAPGDTARTILSRARSIMAREIRRDLHVYLTAMGRRYGVEIMVEREVRGKGMRVEVGGDEWVGMIDKRMREVEGVEDAKGLEGVGVGGTRGGRDEERVGRHAKMVQWMLSNSVTAR